MSGGFFIFIAFISFVICSYFYYNAYKNQKGIKIANYSYYSGVFSLFVASALLMGNILSHNYQIAYIYNYSSNELDLFLLISSFFAGQEGSFLFWTLIIAFLGIFIIKKDNIDQSHNLSLFIYSILLLFFILLVILNSPFEYIWDKYPDIFQSNYFPENGRSLNPILENFWMIIHPPFLFLGYSILFIPFVLFLGNYISNSLDSSLNEIRKWQLLGSAILGIGLILGGVWAYESLGWGGWWGWDPVENASLIPWIISVILIHLLLIQKKKKGFIKSNFFLFFAQSIFIIYSTFLTRTGILQNSMHSFTGSSIPTYYLLIILLVMLFLSSLFIFIRTRNKYPFAWQNSSINFSDSNFYISSAMYAYLIIAIFTLFGTSFPIINSNYSIEPSFYNEINFIPFIISMLLLSLATVINRKNYYRQNKNIIFTISIALIIVISSILAGVNSIGDIIFIISCSLVIAVSISSIISRNKKNILIAIAHLGIGILFIGVIFAGKYSNSAIFSLGNSEKERFNEMTITYIKSERFDSHLTDREKYRFIIQISQDSDTIFAMPVMYIKNNQIYKEPAICSGISKDIYISPLALDSVLLVENYFFSENSSITLSNNININFHNIIRHNNDSNLIGAKISYKYNDSSLIDTIYAKINLDNNSLIEPIWKYFPNIGISICINNIVNNDKVHLAFANQDKPLLKKKESFTFEISSEPLMSLIWLGAFFLFNAMIFHSILVKKSKL